MIKPTREELNALAEKWLSGSITPEEKAVLDQWYDYDSDAPMQRNRSEEEEEIQGARMLANIHERKAKVISIRRGWQVPAAAAAILVMLGAGFFYFNTITRHLDDRRDLLAQSTIQPGDNKAYLVLANGKRITLTDAANGTIEQSSGVVIHKKADGQIVYTSSASAEPIAYNTLETPRGGQYQLQLADGSIVWLNAASSVRYPNRFEGGKRVVELTGEAYFEIAKDKAHPFVVKSKGQSVEVLGTHFNINAYADEPKVKTTLLEGSVRVVHSLSNDEGAILKPGQQATLSEKNITINEADLDEAVAWKNGKFIFNEEPLENIMRKIERWYDVEVIYRDETKKQELFAGSISRFSDVNKLLKLLERTKLAKFKIEQRRIIVY